MFCMEEWTPTVLDITGNSLLFLFTGTTSPIINGQDINNLETRRKKEYNNYENFLVWEKHCV